MTESPQHNFGGYNGLWVCCGPPANDWWDGCFLHKIITPFPFCANNHAHFIFQVSYISSQDPQTYDTDCDGVADAYDYHPLWPSVDTDQDGYNDDVDPWPTDPLLPGSSSKWQLQWTFTRKSDGKKIQEWCDSSGNCFFTFSPGLDPTQTTINSAYSEDWKKLIETGGPTKTYAQIMTEQETLGAYTVTEPAEQMSIGGGNLTPAEEAAMGIGKVVTQLESIKSKMDSIREKMNSMGGGSNINVDLSGVETRLDTANNTLAGIRNDMIKMGDGDENDLPTGANNEFGSTTMFNEAAGNTFGDSAKTAFTSFLNSFIENNPIMAWVAGTGVEISGSQSSVSWSMMGGSYTLDATWLGDKIDSVGLGTFFMALCTFAGLVAILRD